MWGDGAYGANMANRWRGQMDMRVRAPQFAPFAALTGREEEVVGEEIANLANLADLAGGGLKRDKKGIG